VLGKLITTKALGAAAALFLTGGVAAAATGQVPGPWPHWSPSASEVSPTTTDDPTTTSTVEVASTLDTTDSTPDTSTETTTGPDGATGTAPSSTGSTDSPDGADGTALDGSGGEDGKADAVVCADGNHGATVSSVAQDASTLGRDHGKAVSEAARSDCGKDDDGGEVTEPGDDDELSPEDAADERDGDIAPDTSDHAKSTGQSAGGNSKASEHGRSSAGDGGGGTGVGKGGARPQPR
jgi:hypothetical protein